MLQVQLSVICLWATGAASALQSQTCVVCDRLQKQRREPAVPRLSWRNCEKLQPAVAAPLSSGRLHMLTCSSSRTQLWLSCSSCGRLLAALTAALRSGGMHMQTCSSSAPPSRYAMLQG